MPFFFFSLTLALAGFFLLVVWKRQRVDVLYSRPPSEWVSGWD